MKRQIRNLIVQKNKLIITKNYKFIIVPVFAFVLLFCFMLMLSLNVRAYIDPSAVTYMIQVLFGIVIAGGTVAGSVIRKIGRRMGMDKHKKKEMESDDIKMW